MLSEMNKKTILIVLLVIFLLLSCCCASSVGSYFLFKDRVKELIDNGINDFREKINDKIENELNDFSTINDIIEDNISEKNNDEDLIIKDSSISGKIGFPSEYLPEQRVCAVNIQDAKEYCITTKVQSFKIKVPAGNYNVYAMLTEGDYGYKAYYTEFIKCGQENDCGSHDPVIVVVSKGEEVTGIDPIDWYAGN